MKTLLILYLATATLRAADVPWDLAMSRTVPGKNKPGHCSEYARALFQQMRSHDIRAHVLVYVAEPIFVESYPNYPMVHHGYEGHAVCVYYDGKDVWAMDNQLMRPVQIHDGTAEAMARRIAGPERTTTMAYFADASEPPIKGWVPGPNYKRIGQR